jgi:hypothetical protein
VFDVFNVGGHRGGSNFAPCGAFGQRLKRE